MSELGRAVQIEGRVYFTGGATAVLHGWRETTIDVDIKLQSTPPHLSARSRRLSDRTGEQLRY